MHPKFYPFLSILATLFCILGGLVLLTGEITVFDSLLEVGIGLYFVGKGIFVGLLLHSSKPK